MNKKIFLIDCIRKIMWFYKGVVIAVLILFVFPFPAFSYEIMEDIQGGRIRGVVKWNDRTIPDGYIHKIEKNTDFCGKTLMDNALVVNPQNQGMEHVIVYLENIEKGRKPQSRHVNTIKGCRFHPRVMGVVKGNLIGFRHDDFITHNIHLFRFENNATVLNFGLPVHRWQQTIIRKNRKTGIFKLQCDIHAHMNGLIVSLEHDYFSISNSDGEFEIKEIPPGKYRVIAFQGGHQIQNKKGKGKKGFRPIYEKPHQVIQEIKVEMNETAEMVFEFNLDS